MDAHSALADIRGYAGANRILIVRHALAGARRCDAADQGHWKVFGEDLEGDELVCVVAIEAGVVVVTVY